LEDQVPTLTGGQEEKLSVEEAIAAKVQAEQAPDFQAFDEDTGEVQPRDEQGRFASPEPSEPAPAAEQEPPAPTPSPEPVEPPKTHKVKVLGQEEEVPIDELIRNYQKGRAADIKLQEASRKLREADEYVARTRSSPDTAQHQPAPSQDAPQALTLEDIRVALYNEKATDAGDQFREDFPEIAADPYLMDMAARLEEQRLSTAKDLGEPVGDPKKAYRAHGEAIRKWLAQYKPADTTNQDKLEAKRTITAIPAANARAPVPKADRPQTTSEIIEEMRQNRGGRPVPKR
jgi:hypothetical protein